MKGFAGMAAMIGRRWRLIGLVLATGFVLTLLAVLRQAPIYEADATVEVVSPVVAGGAAEMLQVLQLHLTTRAPLLEMIDRHGLFSDQPGLPVSAKVEDLRRAIRFQTVILPAPEGVEGSGVAVLHIRVRLGDAERAARVANDLSQSLLDQASAMAREPEGRHTAGASVPFARLDRALTPESPLPRMIGVSLCLAGLVSLGLGLGLALLLDLWHPVLHNAARMERASGLRPLVVIGDLGAMPRHPLDAPPAPTGVVRSTLGRIRAAVF